MGHGVHFQLCLGIEGLVLVQGDALQAGHYIVEEI